MGSTVVTRGYQITIPKDVRIMTDIHIGDTLVVNSIGENIEVKKLAAKDIESCFGIWTEVEDSVAFVRKIREGSEKRLKRLWL